MNRILKKIAWFILPVDMEVKRELKRERYRSEANSRSDIDHLTATAQWLIRAQSANNDFGVSRGYKAAGFFGYGPKGWLFSPYYSDGCCSL